MEIPRQIGPSGKDGFLFIAARAYLDVSDPSAFPPHDVRDQGVLTSDHKP